MNGSTWMQRKRGREKERERERSSTTHVWSRAPRPHPPAPPNGLGSRPCGVGCVGLIGNPPPSFPPVVWGLVGIPLPSSLQWCGMWWESPSLLWCGVLWVGIPLPPFSMWCGVPPSPVVWGLVGSSSCCGPSRVGSPGGREASLVRQTIFCGRRKILF